MHKTTYWRAHTIYKRGEVIPCPDCRPPFFFHFKVKQRQNHGWTDVWYRQNKQEVMEWNCGSIDVSKNKKWGCVMNINTDRTKPYCSHTLAAQMYLEEKRRQNV